MRSNYLVSAAAAIALVYTGSFIASRNVVRAATQAGNRTRAIVSATTEFLDSLGPDQRESVLFPFAPQKTASKATFARKGGPPGNGPAGARKGAGEGRGANNAQGQGDGRGPGGARGSGGFAGFIGEQYGQAVWSNFPVSDVPRPGLTLGSLNAGQRKAAMHLLEVVLSLRGYQKVIEIMGSDQALADTGTPYSSGISYYTLGIFGPPSATAPWMLQFGGHHLGLNITIAGERGVITPTLTGAQPAVYQSNGKTVRALAQENDRAFALLDSLSESQKKQAILTYQIGDLVLGPGHAGEAIAPEGLKGSAMDEHQRALLLDVISEWAGIVNDAYFADRMEEIKAGLKDTYFAWSGQTTHEPNRNGSAYYRIQGARLLIEFSPQGVGGDSTMHVHTMYRDPANDYGNEFTTNVDRR